MNKPTYVHEYDAIVEVLKLVQRRRQASQEQDHEAGL